MMTATIGSVLSAANAVFEQAKLVKHNKRVANFLTDSFHSLIVQIENVSAIDTDGFESCLGRAFVWVRDTKNVLDLLGQDSDLTQIISARGVQQKLDDLHTRLQILLGEFNNVCGLKILLCQSEYSESVREDHEQTLRFLEGIASSISELTAQQKCEFESLKQEIINQRPTGLQINQVVEANVKAGKLEQNFMPLANVPPTSEMILAVERDRQATREMIAKMGGLKATQEVREGATVDSMTQTIAGTSFSLK